MNLSKHILYSVSILAILVAGCSNPKAVLQSKSDVAIRIKADSLPKNAEAEKLILPYRSSMEAEMNAVLVESDSAIEKGQPESKLGNLVTDICLKRSKVSADFAILNNGGLRTNLPKGQITRGKTFELMPLDNEIVVVTISAQKMLNLLKYVAVSKGVPVSGLRGEILGDSLINVLIVGKAFDPTKNYKVCTTDYLANSGDKMNFFSKPILIETTGYKLRDALIDEFTEIGLAGKHLHPVLDGRLKATLDK